VAAEGYRYLLTIIDRTSRWMEAVPMVVEFWIARYGVPHTVTTDRGTQFASATWACMVDKLGLQLIMTTAYHPQANGMVERLHRQVKEALRARQCGASRMEHLPWVLLGLRAAPKDDSGVSAAEVVFGTTLVLPNQVLEKAAAVEQVPMPTSIPLRARSYAEAGLRGS
jgi:transposase InsO family protein